MATVERENIGVLTDKLIVKISKEDYLPSFEKKLKEYSKTANIPGFRKGMVPTGMIKKMYGSSIFNEEVLRGVEKQLYTYLNETKPDIFAQPLPMIKDVKMDMNSPQDYAFDFEIGLKPQFELPDLAKAGLTMHKVNVTDEMVEDEIGKMQIKGGKMTEPENAESEDTVFNVTFLESDAEGNLTENGIVKDNSVLMKYFAPSFQNKMKGKKAGDSIVIKLSDAFEGDKLNMMYQDLGLDANDKASSGRYFKMNIDKLGLVEKRDLEESFFNEVFPGKEIKTEEDFRKQLKEEIQQYWDSQSRNQLHDQIYHALLDETKMEFPESFLKRWLEKGGEEPKTPEQAEKEYPGFSNQLKWTLISDRIISENKLEVNSADLRENMKQEVMRYFGQMNMGEDMEWLDSYLDRMMKDEKQVDSTYRRMVTEKLFTHLETTFTPKEKTVSVDELNAMQHHHHH